MSNEIELHIKMTDEQYDIVEGEAKEMDMTMEELFANTLAVIINDIVETVKTRNEQVESEEVEQIN